MSSLPAPPTIAVIGGGPAGLMAAETLRHAGVAVELFEAKASPGRKFLIAGKGGLNLTHSDPRGVFDARYRERADVVGSWLDGFDADALRAWARGLGVSTYVGSSGRVFPDDRKAAPLLRGWVRRLREQGVRMAMQHRWVGWDAQGALVFDTPDGPRSVHADATVLAMGGGSWPELGSDGAWVDTLAARGIDLAPLQAANCGFDIDWTPHFSSRHAGDPLRPLVAHWIDLEGQPRHLQGECVVSQYGIEGSLVYALSADLRETINRDGSAVLKLDLVPGRSLDQLREALARPRGGRSFSEHLRRNAGVSGVQASLVYEVLGRAAGDDTDAVAAILKALPLRLLRPRPIAEAISTAGGVRLEAMDDALMLRALPGTFCAGEMLDWEAPTGGYLLTACFASGQRAAQGALEWLAHRT